MKYTNLQKLILEQQNKVGKRPGSGVYVQYEAIVRNQTNLTNKELEMVNKGMKFLPKGFHFDFIWTDGMKSARFMEMSDLYDAHPHVVNSMIYTALDNKVKPGKSQGQIYHRLDTMVSPSHPSYGFHKRISDYELRAGLLGPKQPKGIGWLKVWKTWIEENGIPYDEYLETVESFK